MESLSFTNQRTVNYYYFSNPQQLDNIKKLLEKYQYLIPPWITRVSVQINRLDYNTVANVTTDSHYMQAKICISEAFFENTPEWMERIFVHEILHTAISELSDWMFDMMEAANLDDKTKAILEKERMIRNERLTEFISQAIMRNNDIQNKTQF